MIGGAVSVAGVLDYLHVRRLADGVLEQVRGAAFDWHALPESSPASASARSRQAELESLGYRLTGDVRVKEKLPGGREFQLVVRTSIASDERTYAAIECAASVGTAEPVPFDRARIQLVTELTDGRFLYTVEGRSPAESFNPAEIEHSTLDEGVSASRLHRTHQERLAATDPTTVHALGDIEESQRREFELKRAARLEAAGRGLTHRELLARIGHHL